MSISLVRRCLKPGKLVSIHSGLYTRSKSSESYAKTETDSYGIPIHPTWSVNDLLSSYPTPTISSTTLRRLHELSALIPPEEGSAEHDKLKQEMEDLVKLVEAVKLVDLSDGPGDAADHIPDGRIWTEGTGIQPGPVPANTEGEVTGAALLKYGARTSDGYYVVDADRTR